jgi:hypothetical protein
MVSSIEPGLRLCIFALRVGGVWAVRSRLFSAASERLATGSEVRARRARCAALSAAAARWHGAPQATGTPRSRGVVAAAHALPHAPLANRLYHAGEEAESYTTSS